VKSGVEDVKEWTYAYLPPYSFIVCSDTTLPLILCCLLNCSFVHLTITVLRCNAISILLDEFKHGLLLLSRFHHLTEFDVLNIGHMWNKSGLGVKDVFYIKVHCWNLFKLQ
jgi:hypothetical protein